MFDEEIAVELMLSGTLFSADSKGKLHGSQQKHRIPHRPVSRAAQATQGNRVD